MGLARTLTSRSKTLLRSLVHQAGFAVGRLRPAGTANPEETRIAFQVFAVHHACFFRELIHRLRQLDNTSVTIVVLPHPHFSRADRSQLENYLAQDLGIPRECIAPMRKLINEPFDLAFYVDTFARQLRRSPRSVLLYHGIGTPKRFTRKGFYRHTAYDFDDVMAPSSSDQEILEACRPAGDATRIRNVGSVIFERLRDLSGSRAEYLTGHGLDPGKPAVLLAPHWTRLTSADASCRRSIKQTLALLQQLDCQVIVKLHSMSYYAEPNRGFDWLAAASRWAGAAVHVDSSPDDVEALSFCDVLITDVSSRALVFAALGKPCILHIDDSEVPVTRDSVHLEWESYRVLRESSWQSGNLAELEQLLRRLCAEPEPVEGRRAEPLPWDGRTDATQAIVEYCLAPPDAVSASS